MLVFLTTPYFGNIHQSFIEYVLWVGEYHRSWVGEGELIRVPHTLETSP